MEDTASNIAIITQALVERGFAAEQLMINQTPFTRFSKDGHVRWLTYHSPALAYPTTHNAIRELSRNKSLASNYVASMGYSVPMTIRIDDCAQLVDHEEIIQNAPLIVKPVYGSLSRGVVRDIMTIDDLRSTVKEGLKRDNELVIQKQITGEEVRFVVIKQHLRAAILRKRPVVTGDGLSTVEQLIKNENDSRRAITNTMAIYPALDSSMLDRDDIAMDYIPREGEEVILGNGTMIMNGASMYNVLDIVHEGYRTMVEDIAKSIKADFIVIDIMTHDVAVFENYWFIEFNTSPVLKLFYSTRDGHHFDAAAELATMIEEATAL